MASFRSLLQVIWLDLILRALPLVSLILSRSVLSQDPASSTPNIASCQPQLMSLVPCAPFVQGTAQLPTQQCCDNLNQIYTQQPHCLCLLLNNSALISLPINRTLATELPRFCNIQADISTCSGVGVPASPPTTSVSQVSHGARTNSTVAASPVVEVAPRPSIIRSGNGLTSGSVVKIGNDRRVIAVTMATFLLVEVFS